MLLVVKLSVYYDYFARSSFNALFVCSFRQKHEEKQKEKRNEFSDISGLFYSCYHVIGSFWFCVGSLSYSSWFIAPSLLASPLTPAGCVFLSKQTKSSKHRLVCVRNRWAARASSQVTMKMMFENEVADPDENLKRSTPCCTMKRKASVQQSRRFVKNGQANHIFAFAVVSVLLTDSQTLISLPHFDHQRLLLQNRPYRHPWIC